ncbi:MAG: HEAT repeat domain-containing protein [Phycisphaerae bacterium]|jgi:HEAT repeat protein|nr:HEAT repeat domain-containing protein [Phycisphaerae bacterium]
MVLNTRYITTYIILATVAISAVAFIPAVAAADENETKLIGVLTSKAPQKDKAITCKKLAIFGSKAAVPALAPLLADKDLASWARIALEAIPGPEADEALRKAAGTLKGNLLIGAINSISVRRDADAVDLLVGKLKDADAEVASAAGEALGRIGGDSATDALEKFLPNAPSDVKSSVAYGCILCAERLHAAGKSAAAVKLYDAVRKEDLPQQRHIEAIRGAILARGSAGIPLLLAQLKSSDKAMFGVGLRTARELPGGDVTDALVGELDKLKANRRAFLILALADRRDPKALPAVLAAVKSGPTNVRLMAMGTLEGFGSASCIPVLLTAALDTDADVAQKAKSTLARLPRGEVDTDITARLPKASPKTRAILIYLAGLRRIESALPALVKCTSDTDADCRAAAIAAVGTIGEKKHVPSLVKILLKTSDAKEREGIAKALQTISARAGSACADDLMPLAKNSDKDIRVIALRVLACAGGGDALTAVKSALSDKDEGVQDEAARTLSTWPDNWPEDAAVTAPLLALAKTGKKLSHRILAFRGYLQYVQGAKKLNDDQKLVKLEEILPLTKRREEKLLVLSALGQIRTGGALKMLATMAGDPVIAEAACSTIVNLLRSRKGVKNASKQQRRAVLETAVAKSKSARTKKTAQQLLKAIR